MFTRVVVACFAVYCVHGARNTTRDVSALAGQGVALAREAAANAPQTAVKFCLENKARCAKSLKSRPAGQAAPAPETTAQGLRRPGAPKKA